MSGRPSALITGITGQDGSYLAELLLDKGYEVHGMVRRSSTEKFDRIEHLRNRVTLHQADLLDERSLVDALRAARPAEIYNLAAMSFVAVSWIQPTLTAEFTGVGVTRILEAMRDVCPEARFYQASSSEMFGKVREVPQTESTAFYPRSPYGVAKVYGHFITVNYRESYGLRATSGILFNHESPRRGLEFVTRKITWHAAAIRLGLADTLTLGNLDAERDWGYAKDYVEAMWLMLQHDVPEDYVIATGVAHSVRDCVEIAFDQAGVEIDRHVEIDQALKRPAEVDHLIGDASKAKRELGWEPRTGFEELIRLMVDADYELLSEGRRAAARAARTAALGSDVVVAVAAGVAHQPQTRHRAALVTGLTGQDGSFLAELLLDRGYHVTGLVRDGAERLGFSEHLRGRIDARPRRPARARDAHGRGRRGPARRAVPPRGAVVHARLLGAAGRDARRDRRRDRDAARGGSHLMPGGARVRGRVGRDVRRRPGEPPERGHALPSADAVRDGEARRAPAHRAAARP